MKGMGRYTAMEMEISHLSSDELNELYLNGNLEKAYDYFERTGEVKVYTEGNKKRRKRKED